MKYSVSEECNTVCCIKVQKSVLQKSAVHVLQKCAKECVAEECSTVCYTRVQFIFLQKSIYNTKFISCKIPSYKAIPDLQK